MVKEKLKRGQQKLNKVLRAHKHSSVFNEKESVFIN